MPTRSLQGFTSCSRDSPWNVCEACFSTVLAGHEPLPASVPLFLFLRVLPHEKENVCLLRVCFPLRLGFVSLCRCFCAASHSRDSSMLSDLSEHSPHLHRTPRGSADAVKCSSLHPQTEQAVQKPACTHTRADSGLSSLPRMLRRAEIFPHVPALMPA